MKKMLFWFVGLFLLVAIPTQSAGLERCRIKVDRKNGTISFNVNDVVGTLLWGNTPAGCLNAVQDSACVADGKARKCTLDVPGTLAARTAPYDCTLDLCDDVAATECYIKGCTVRPEPPLCSAGEVLTWDGYAFQCIPDDSGAGGTVTTVNSGPGLSGGPITTSGTLQINASPCSGTDKLTWNGSAFFCSPDSQGVTMITSGPGLTGGVITSTGSLAVNAPKCTSSQKLGFFGASGFACTADQDTTYSAGNQLSLMGTTFNVLEGSGSDLDADLLDGLTSAAFAPRSHSHTLSCTTVSGSLSSVASASVYCPAGRFVTGGGGKCVGPMGSRIALSETINLGDTGWAVSCMTTADTLYIQARCCTVN